MGFVDAYLLGEALFLFTVSYGFFSRSHKTAQTGYAWGEVNSQQFEKTVRKALMSSEK